MGYADVPERHSSLRPKKSDYVLVPSPEATEIMVDALQGELARLREYIELLENQVIVAMTVDEPVPFLPVDPEEQRRLDAKASDGTQCMIYRSN
jgi:hypothetical protein